jgi:hypothetical protein
MTGTFTLQEAPSFAQRDNDKREGHADQGASLSTQWLGIEQK